MRAFSNEEGIALSKLQFWIVTVVAALGLATTAANIALLTHNRSVQAEVSQRQQYVQQSLQLEGLYREIVRALSELAARQNDDTLRALLQKHGVAAPAAAQVPAPAAAPAAPQAGGRK